MAAPTPVTYTTAYSNDYRLYIAVNPGQYDPVTNSTPVAVSLVVQVRNGQAAVAVGFNGYLNIAYRGADGTTVNLNWTENPSVSRFVTDYYVARTSTFTMYHPTSSLSTFTVTGSYGTVNQGGPDDMPTLTITSKTYSLISSPSYIAANRGVDGQTITVLASGASGGTETLVGYEYQYSTNNATWSSAYPMQFIGAYWSANFGPTSPIAVDPVTGYYFRARAVGTYSGPWSVSAYSASTATVPYAPVSISVTVDGASALVAVGASINNGGAPITGYYLQYTRDGGTTWSTPVAIPSLSYTYSGLINGTYKFRAYATNAVGNSSYQTSNDRVINVITTLVEVAPPEFSAYPIYSAPYGPNKIRIQWRKPQGSWDYLLLVRSTLGFPVTPDDGTPLLLVTPSGHDNLQFPLMDPEIKLNDYPLIDNQVYYYSVFVRGTGTTSWTKAATTMATSVKDYKTAQMMYDSLPLPYKSSTYSTSLTDAPTELNQDLVNFLKVFAAEYETFKASASNMGERYNIAKLDGRLVPLMLQQLGMSYETELGLAQGRRMLSAFAKNTKQHGSVAGLKSFVTAFSGYNCTISGPINLMLNSNDSSAEVNVGNWVTASSGANATGISRAPASVVTPYIEVATSTTPTNLQAGCFVFAAGNAGIQVRLGYDSPKTTGIPVKPSTAYTFSAYSKANFDPRSVTLYINWYDKSGVFVSSVAGSGTTNSTSGWTRASATGTSPSNAAFAVLQINILSAASGEYHFFDAMQFEKGSSATTFAEARRVDINLLPNRTNLVRNPQVSSGTTNWTAGSTVGLTNVSNRIRCLGTATVGTTDLLMTYQDITVSAGRTYTFSAFLRSPATVAAGAYDGSGAPLVQAYTRITWLNSSGSAISNVVSDYKVPMWYGNSAFDEIAAATGTAPTGAVTARVSVYTTSTDNAAVSGVYPEVLVSKLLFEEASGALPYFDGSLSTLDVSTTGYKTVLNPNDVSWSSAGSVNGVSYFYLNKNKVVQRLKAVIPDQLPAAAPWALFYS